VDRVAWDPPPGPQPLAQLVQLQLQIAAQLELADPPAEPARIGGLDVAYTSDGWATAAYVEIDCQTFQVAWCHRIAAPEPFPYIPSLLTFRELPLHLKLLAEVEAAGRRPDLLFVDGSGILHPRRAGVATSVGVVTDLPTVGVTKRLLSGSYPAWTDQDLDQRLAGSGRSRAKGSTRQAQGGREAGLAMRPVMQAGALSGWAVLGPGASRRPVFLSPGHRTTVDWIAAHIDRYWGPWRLPAPIRWSDRLSRAAIDV
jgi:deoxyribonuclease V